MAINDTTKYIWDFFKSKGFNDYAVAGIMGNIEAESNFAPNNLEGKYETESGYTDQSYTQAVDSGAYKNFTNDSYGYGLAQWTSSSRKQKLYNFAQEAGTSIGDLDTQLEFMWRELNMYTNVFTTLQNAKSVGQASSVVLAEYENPAYHDHAGREELSQKYFTAFADQSSVARPNSNSLTFLNSGYYKTPTYSSTGTSSGGGGNINTATSAVEDEKALGVFEYGETLVITIFFVLLVLVSLTGVAKYIEKKGEKTNG